MDDYLEFITIPQRISGAAAAALGVLELLLAAMALYGVIAFTVARRTREIGIRVALGASASSVARLIMRDGCVLALAGVGLGLIVSVAAAPALASLLIGVGPADPISIAGTAAVILGVAVAASYVPARRALRVDPSAALRTE
jgi:ABC-type antimicrobial peptide transport system permease subunit